MNSNRGLWDTYHGQETTDKETLNLYINMHDKGALKVPVGLTDRKK